MEQQNKNLTLIIIALLASMLVGAHFSSNGNPFWAPWWPADGDETTVCQALQSTSNSYTLPSARGWYEITAVGNAAYLLEGSSPTATTATNGHSIVVPDGVPKKLRLAGPDVAYIANSTAGEICFVHLNKDL